MRAQVEELIGVDLGDGGGVRAADIVCLDLEPGDRVGVGALGEQQVAAESWNASVFLARLRSTMMLLLPDGARAVLHRTPRNAKVAEVVFGAACSCVVLEVDVLASRAVAVGAGHARLRCPGRRDASASARGAEREPEAERNPVETSSIAADRCILGAKDPGVLFDRFCPLTKKRSITRCHRP